MNNHERSRIALPNSRQALQALRQRWEQLKQQFGPAAAQNEEYIRISQILQEVMRQQQVHAQNPRAQMHQQQQQPGNMGPGGPHMDQHGMPLGQPGMGNPQMQRQMSTGMYQMQGNMPTNNLSTTPMPQQSPYLGNQMPGQGTPQMGNLPVRQQQQQQQQQPPLPQQQQPQPWQRNMTPQNAGPPPVPIPQSGAQGPNAQGPETQGYMYRAPRQMYGQANGQMPQHRPGSIGMPHQGPPPPMGGQPPVPNQPPQSQFNQPNMGPGADPQMFGMQQPMGMPRNVDKRPPRQPALPNQRFNKVNEPPQLDSNGFDAADPTKEAFSWLNMDALDGNGADAFNDIDQFLNEGLGAVPEKIPAPTAPAAMMAANTRPGFEQPFDRVSSPRQPMPGQPMPFRQPPPQGRPQSVDHQQQQAQQARSQLPNRMQPQNQPQRMGFQGPGSPFISNQRPGSRLGVERQGEMPDNSLKLDLDRKKTQHQHHSSLSIDSTNDILRSAQEKPNMDDELSPSDAFMEDLFDPSFNDQLEDKFQPDDLKTEGSKPAKETPKDTQTRSQANTPALANASPAVSLQSAHNTPTPANDRQTPQPAASGPQRPAQLDVAQANLLKQQQQAQQSQKDFYSQRYLNRPPKQPTHLQQSTVKPPAHLLDRNQSLRMPDGVSIKPELAQTSQPSGPRSIELLERFGFNGHVNPWSLLPEKISFEMFCHRKENFTIPSLLPLGVSAQGMKRARNRVIMSAVMDRRRALDNSEHRSIEDEIELRLLRLFKWQRAVRGDLLTAVHYFNSTSIDRSNRVHFARLKRLSSHEAALVEQFYNQQSLLRGNQTSQKQHGDITAIISASEAMQRLAITKSQMRQKRNYVIMEHHAHAEREEKRRAERTAKQRLKALRANDEEAYIKLLGDVKDTRITHLLQQTNRFLDSLAQAVQSQQQANIKQLRAHGINVPEISAVVPSGDDDEAREKIDYYEVAHRIKEEVTEQPSILVGGTLKEYQLKGLQWMVSLYNNNLNGILADEMGLGKTIQSIALISYLVEKKGLTGPFLVLVPLSTMTNWSIEFETWAPSLKKIDYKGPPLARKAKQAAIRQGDFHVLLTTYEYIIKDKSILSRIKWAHMIIDEGHRMKNAQSKLSATLQNYYQVQYRLILTGTPLQNNLPELWALLNFVLPKIFNSVKSFDEWFNQPFANAGSNDKIDLSEEETLLIIRRLHKVLRPFLLRRLKKDVEKDLPDKTEKVIKCRMSALQSTLYRQIVRHNAFYFGDSENGQRTVTRGLNNTLMQLRKLCNHPFAFPAVENLINPSSQTNDLLWRVAGKFELLDRILPKFRASGHRILMFFQMTTIMDIMEDFLRYRNMMYLRLDGNTKADERSDLLKKYNEPDSPYFCFLLSTRAGGLGLNLQTADTVIIFDTDWNPHQDLQAQDRAHRIGQTKEVRILRLITEDSIEEKILERAQGKLRIDGKVIQAGKFDNKSTAEEQEALLRSLLEEEESSEAKDAGETDNMDDDELNSMLARDEAERELFASIDRARMTQQAHLGTPSLFTEAELPEECTDAFIEKRLAEEQQTDLSQPKRSRATRRVNGTYSDDVYDDHSRKRMKTKNSSSGSNGIGSSSSASRKRRGNISDSPSSPEDSGPPMDNESYERARYAPLQAKRKTGRPARVHELLNSEERHDLQKAAVKITNRLKSLQAPDKRSRIEIFLEPPPRKLYPDYYKVIENPIAVNLIEKRIDNKVYQSLEQFGYDWRLMFANARRYNEEGSFVFEDAMVLEEEFCNLYEKIKGEQPPIDPNAPKPLKKIVVPQEHTSEPLPQPQSQPQLHEKPAPATLAKSQSQSQQPIQQPPPQQPLPIQQPPQQQPHYTLPQQAALAAQDPQSFLSGSSQSIQSPGTQAAAAQAAVDLVASQPYGSTIDQHSSGQPTFGQQTMQPHVMQQEMPQNMMPQSCMGQQHPGNLHGQSIQMQSGQNPQMQPQPHHQAQPQPQPQPQPLQQPSQESSQVFDFDSQYHDNNDQNKLGFRNGGSGLDGLDDILDDGAMGDFDYLGQDDYR